MANAQPEPSMEEILASIRRIISEDEEDQPGVDRAPLDALAHDQAAAEVAKEVNEVASQQEQPSADDNALTRMLDIAEGKNLNKSEASEGGNSDVVENEPLESVVDHDGNDDNADIELETKDVKMVKQAAVAQEAEETIVDTVTADAAAAAFGNLSRSVRVADDNGQTLENIVTEMLRPMVKDWLDNNLTRIVEEKVEYEVQRLSRRG